MAYRDDVDALRSRNEALERELSEAHSELEQYQAAEFMLRESAQLVEKQRKLVAHLGGRSDDKRRRIVTAVLLIGCLLTIAVLGFMVGKANDQRRRLSWHLSEMASQRQRLEGEVQRVNSQLRQCLNDARNAGAPRSSWSLGTAQASSSFDPVVREGSVRRVSGQSPVERDDQCTVEVLPASGVGRFNAQVRVICEGQVIYGGSSLGYLVVGLEEGRPNIGRDDNVTGSRGDPMLELDLADNRVMVADGPSPDAVSYSVEIVLDEVTTD